MFALQMISDSDLQRWTDFLADQTVALDAAYLAHTGKPHLATPELVAFLRVNDGIVKEQVERAISGFAKENAWPSWLNSDQIINLTHRARFAHGLLIMISNGQLPHIAALQMPKASDRPRFLQWLLIEMWRYGGDAYLDALTNSYFADPR